MHFLVRAAAKRAKASMATGQGSFVELLARDIDLMRAYGRRENLPPEPKGPKARPFRERAVAIKREAAEELVALAEARAEADSRAAGEDATKAQAKAVDKTLAAADAAIARLDAPEVPGE